MNLLQSAASRTVGERDAGRTEAGGNFGFPPAVCRLFVICYKDIVPSEQVTVPLQSKCPFEIAFHCAFVPV